MFKVLDEDPLGELEIVDDEAGLLTGAHLHTVHPKHWNWNKTLTEIRDLRLTNKV